MNEWSGEAEPMQRATWAWDQEYRKGMTDNRKDITGSKAERREWGRGREQRRVDGF